ncbi:MAG: M15 family metallopeptidase [Cyanobacteria bacterium P01_F01_bin.150]
MLNVYAVSRFIAPQERLPSHGITRGVEAELDATPVNEEVTTIEQKVVTSPVASPPAIAQVPISDDTQESRHGHLRYAEADPESLTVIGSFGVGQYQRYESLAPDAALALMDMIYAARDQGVWVVPASAYRTIDRQRKLFDNQVKRKGSAEAAAKSSAPPGFSEHHTGYAVDLVDGRNKEADINQQFATTQAFEWLTQNASKYGYELSFTQNNEQGVNYEPWHWRFIGSEEALAIFRQARP